jgi:hypothetical protein
MLLAGAGCLEIEPIRPEPLPPEVLQPVPVPAPDPYGPEAKKDLVRIASLQPGDVVSSPLTVEGEARGYWYFEASFPIRLYDAVGKELAVGIAQAQAEWMTEGFVPYKATLEFISPGAGSGTLVFEKDNPSGLPQFDDRMEIPVRF